VNFARLLELVGDEPVFDSAVLLAGPVNPADLRCQLSRWTKAGRLIQLRRGVYTLAPPYQKIKPHPFLIANRLLPASYVSLQSALDYYGLIPDVAHGVTSVTTKRPHRWQTPLGSFIFYHIKPTWLHAYRRLEVSVCLRRHAGEGPARPGLSSPARRRPGIPSGTSPTEPGAPGLGAATCAGGPVG
jgi:hypothetical protein